MKTLSRHHLQYTGLEEQIVYAMEQIPLQEMQGKINIISTISFEASLVWFGSN